MSGSFSHTARGTEDAPIAEWRRFVEAFASASAGFAGEAGDHARSRDLLRARVRGLQQGLAAGVAPPDVPEGLPRTVANALRDAIRALQGAQRAVLEDVAAVVEDFEHAAENEDRFVVLVFGEVNAGKSALANHVAGLDFPTPVVPRAECFVGEDGTPPRLEESPVECTRDYQGFRLPGLLWIDCPGVLSATPVNAAMARRLVARADLLVFASSSDAPFKRSELEELRKIIEGSASDRLDAVLVITRADRTEEDVDDDGNLVKRLAVKPQADIDRQTSWAREHLELAGITKCVRLEPPRAVSVYVARDTLGLSWKTAQPQREPHGDPAAYAASGIPDLLRTLGKVVTREGAAIKARWPVKRARALRATVIAKLGPSRQRLETLAETVRAEREALAAKADEAAKIAAERAAARVAPCLGGNGIHRPGTFKREVAERELRQHLRREVERAVSEVVRGQLERASKGIGEAVKGFVDGAAFELEVHERYRQRKFKSDKKGRGVGQALGGAGGGVGGMYAGAAVGVLFGPVGAFVGGLIGAVVGGVGGGFAGGAVGAQFEEEVKLRVPAGTNGAEVIAEAQKAMRASAQKAARATIKNLDAALFAPVADSLETLKSKVDEWDAATALPRSMTAPRTAVKALPERRARPAGEKAARKQKSGRR